jgi:TonB family protein
MRKLTLILLFVAALRGWAQSPILAPDKDGVYSPGGGIMPPRVVHTAPAQFPADARRKEKKYYCIVSTVIDVEGKPISMHVEEQDAGPFGAAAIEAVEESEFKPGLLDGEIPVPVRIEVWVPFVAGEKRAVPEVLPVKVESFTKLNDKNNRPPIFRHGAALQYSDEARREHFEGTVLVQFIVNDRGVPEDIQIMRAVGHGLDQKAIEEVGTYRFEPGLKWGLPAAYPATVELQFRLH